MPPPDDLPPPRRRPLLRPLLLACVLLAAIGTYAGLALGERARQRAQTGATESPDVAGPAYRGGEADEPGQTGQRCRPETQEQAAAAGAVGVLRAELSVRTATSVVWICADDRGRLFYHANRRNSQGAWIENETALFLTDVTAVGDGFRAVAPNGQGRRTTFLVTAQRLLIKHKDGTAEEQRTVSQ